MCVFSLDTCVFDLDTYAIWMFYNSGTVGGVMYRPAFEGVEVLLNGTYLGLLGCTSCDQFNNLLYDMSLCWEYIIKWIGEGVVTGGTCGIPNGYLAQYT